MARAISSLPVPVSPTIRTQARDGATWRVVRTTSRKPWLQPMTPGSVNSLAGSRPRCAGDGFRVNGHGRASFTGRSIQFASMVEAVLPALVVASERASACSGRCRWPDSSQPLRCGTKSVEDCHQLGPNVGVGFLAEGCGEPGFLAGGDRGPEPPDAAYELSGGLPPQHWVTRGIEQPGRPGCAGRRGRAPRPRLTAAVGAVSAQPRARPAPARRRSGQAPAGLCDRWRSGPGARPPRGHSRLVPPR